MEIYKIGKIVSIGKNYIIFESNNKGNLIYVAETKKFKLSQNVKIFIYKYQTEYINNLYGFWTFQERILFQDLLNINGVGPKTAISLLKEGKDVFIDILINENIESLCDFPYIGSKTARQIIFELSQKYKNITNKKNKVMPSMLKRPLKTLGFNNEQIEYAIKNVKPQKQIESLIEESIKLISNAKFS